jgi:high-affinity Fe2+/Pb2+ permease
MNDDRSKFWMQVLVSLVLLVAGLWIIAEGTDQAASKAAFGWIGAIVGYWLR